MMTALLILMLGLFGFVWVCWWLGCKAAQNPAATDLGVRLGKWLLK
jgi:hypothetical protein